MKKVSIMGLILLVGCGAATPDLGRSQAVAHDALAAVFGATPAGPLAAPALSARLVELRLAVEADKVVLTNRGEQQILGLRGIVYEAYGYTENYPDVSVLIDEIAADLNNVHPRAGEFFAATKSTQIVDGREVNVRGIDPSLARLTDDLTGSNGARAMAVLVETDEPTEVRKWPGTFTSCLADCPAAGGACSTADLLAGFETTQLISRTGNYYRCR